VALVDRVSSGLAGLRNRGSSRFSFDDLAEYLSFGGVGYPLVQTTMASVDREQVGATSVGALSGSSPVFALVLARLQAFSQARFQWTRYTGSQPGDLFGSPELAVLERPWPGGTTSDLLARMEIHVSGAGQSYVTRPRRDRLSILRPDRVTIVMGSQTDADNPAEAPDVEVVGYLHTTSHGKMTPFGPTEVAHYAPYPDPNSRFLGMSWITPALREYQADSLATEHKAAFFSNAATPNLAIKFDASISIEKVRAFKALLEAEYQGTFNAWKTLYLGGGADPVPVGLSFKDMDYAVIQGRAEPLAVDTPIPTLTGWTTMGEVTPGEQVFGRDGRPATVTAAGPVHHDRDCYRITLKNGESIVADAGHVWAAIDRGTAARREREYTTRELYDIFTRPYPNGSGGGHRLSLPASPVLDMPEADLLVDPYVLGAWLGDGQTAGAAICGDWADLKYIAAEIEERGYRITRWKSGKGVTPGRAADNTVIGMPGGLLSALSALGVLGDKRIPQHYLRASLGQRLDLLRGLMDTDGTADGAGQGQCALSAKDEHLARQVLELVRSLGYRATIHRRADSRSRTGYQWKVQFRSRLDCLPFLLPRKADRCVNAGDPHYSGMRSIVSVEPVESVPVRCITVDTDDHLFLAGDGFVPTHNSRLAADAGVPPSWVGFSEGLQGSALNAGNFDSARKRFAQGTMAHLWTNAASSLQVLLSEPPPVPKAGPATLCADTRVPFMREDAGDVAAIQQQQAVTIATLVKDGFTPESVVAAVTKNDFGLLVHSGLVSVQLNPPGSGGPPLPAPNGASPNGKSAGVGA